MRVRGSTGLAQLGWMMLGSVAGSTIALSVIVLVGVDNLAIAFGWIVIFLTFSVALSVALTVVPWGGYQLGSLLARRWDVREAAALAAGAVAALVIGGAAIAISVAIVDGFAGVYVVPVIAGLLGAVLVVTLARLPLDTRYVPRHPHSAE